MEPQRQVSGSLAWVSSGQICNLSLLNYRMMKSLIPVVMAGRL
jgi:hypothetical protein